MISASKLQIAYEDNVVVHDFDFVIQPGEIVSLIGPNGSGKSTVLKAISRLMKTLTGVVHLDGLDIHKLPTREVAKKLSILSQHQITPPDFTVEELISYGRLPHRNWYQSKNKDDIKYVQWALEQTHLEKLAHRPIDSLSGGERQRAWIAMALAQKTSVLLLDEPTTYLDICHQIETMELLTRLNRELDLTIVMVLHDLNQAVRYSHRLVVIKEGKLVTSGTPEKVLTTNLLRDVYKVKARITLDQCLGKPVFLPLGLASPPGA